MSEAYPLPPVFQERIRAQLGAEADDYFAALAQPYVRGLRLNPRKPLADPAALIEGLGEPVPWQLRTGRYLSQESTAGAQPLHEAGAYYIQEPSAMAAVAVLSPRPGERVLDLCAAPGGKSTQIADVLEGRGLLVSNEPVPSRAKILSRNLERMGVTNGLVVSAEPEQLAPRWAGFFDAILVDAPCSGEGMFRRHPETRAEWTEQSPAGCAARQKRILNSAWAMLRPGGRLVYSTCTLNTEENEGVINWMQQAVSDCETAAFTLPAGEGRGTGRARRDAASLSPPGQRGRAFCGFPAQARRRTARVRACPGGCSGQAGQAAFTGLRGLCQSRRRSAAGRQRPFRRRAAFRAGAAALTGGQGLTGRGTAGGFEGQGISARSRIGAGNEPDCRIPIVFCFPG